MPITSHGVLQDDPLNHAAFVEYRTPCVPATISPAGQLNWTWTVQFIDSNGDGRAELLMVRAAHRTAPHAGEPANNTVGPILYLNPCRIKRLAQTLVPDPHGSHEDRLVTCIREFGVLWFVRRRLYIVLKHTDVDATIDIPDIPTGGGGGILKG